MLVLSRRHGEQIRIGSNIELTVVAILGDRVRLGFQAPPQIAINRREVHDRIGREMPDEVSPGERPIAGCQ